MDTTPKQSSSSITKALIIFLDLSKKSKKSLSEFLNSPIVTISWDESEEREAFKDPFFFPWFPFFLLTLSSYYIIVVFIFNILKRT